MTPEQLARLRMLARKGGEATKAKYGQAHYQRIAPLGGAAGKGKVRGPKAKPDPKSQPAASRLLTESLDAIMADLERPRE